MVNARKYRTALYNAQIAEKSGQHSDAYVAAGHQSPSDSQPNSNLATEGPTNNCLQPEFEPLHFCERSTTEGGEEAFLLGFDHSIFFISVNIVVDLEIGGCVSIVGLLRGIGLR